MYHFFGRRQCTHHTNTYHIHLAVYLHKEIQPHGLSGRSVFNLCVQLSVQLFKKLQTPCIQV